MAIVITNGTYFITYTSSGATKKVTDINEAYKFSSVSDAVRGMKKAEGKTKSYFVFDTLTKRTLWKWMTQKEIIKMQEERQLQQMIKRDKHGKIKRKTYSQDARKLIYNNANGCCELCGKKILFEDMTIDHVNPLSMGGEDTVENLACTCYSCNLFKGNVLASDFMERITEIFMYQMEKKYKNKFTWKIAHKLLERMI